jgi:dehydrogenase/reductase SDR family member 7B
MQGLENKVMIVTGASSGIGAALALAGLSHGMKVVMAARRMEPMEALVRGAGFAPDSYLLVRADVGREADCEQLVRQAVESFGRLDVLINNAGISMRALFSDSSPEVLERIMQVNFWGAVYCTHFALPWLLKSGGSVVGISSVAGFKGLPARTGYSASKFALQGFLESLRIENRKTGLHVLIACPGFTASNIRRTALAGDGKAQGESPRDEGRMMTAETAARHIMRAVKQRKTSLVLTRQGKLTLLLNKLFPKWVDKLVYKHMAGEPDSPFK